MVKFHLDKKEGQESPIFLSLYHRGRRIRVYTGKKIEAPKWDLKTCRANPRKYKTNCVGFNSYLDGLSNEVTELVNENKPISKSDIKSIVDKALGKNTNETFYGFAEAYIGRQIEKGELQVLSAKAYRVTLNHLQKVNPALEFSDIDINFYDKFVSYLRTQGISTNSIGGHIKRLKWFMAASLDRDLHSNVSFKKRTFKTVSEETDQIYLNKKEINKLAKKKLPPRLKKVADAFVMNCFLGQRYSDWNKLLPENFTHQGGQYTWHIVQDKGKANQQVKIAVPVPNEVLPLLKRYNFTCPVIGKDSGLISVQKYNDYLKEAAELAGLDAIEDIRSNGEVTKAPKFSLVKSHTARRSFATNLYLEGVPIQDIMAITGHKREETFLLYVRADQLTKSKGLAKHYLQKKHAEMKVVKGGRAA